MPNLFSGINVALRAMLSQQQAIEVIEHNVSNANTVGYRRQSAVLKPGPAYPPLGLHTGNIVGQLGTGVEVSAIMHYKLEFFDGRYRRELADAAGWEMQSQVLQQVEATLGETEGTGVIPYLDAFWQGWQAVSDNPSDANVRTTLVRQAEELTQAINRRAIDLIKIQEDQNLSIEQRVAEINDLASQVAALNAEISNVQATGNNANDLIDGRDMLLDRLAEIAGATAKIQDNQDVTVSIGGHALVVGTTAFELTTAPDPANGNLLAISWEQDGRPLRLERGELLGLFESRDRIIPAQLDGLNTLAYELANQVNAVHQTGYGTNNATSLNFFAPFATTNYALELSVNPVISSDPANLASAAAADSPGDGNVAGLIAELKNALVMNGGTATLNQYYTGKIGELGLAVKDARGKAADHSLVAGSMDNMRESVSGVNLDEEAANMVSAQRAFQAASRLLTTVDEMINQIINGMGLVGR